MFRLRLKTALAVLALISLLQGALGLWALDLAADKVVRGRVASDIHNGFIQLSEHKQRLKAWLAGHALMQDSAASASAQLLHQAERQRLVHQMRRSLDRIDALSGQAGQHDPGDPAVLREHEQRRNDVALLRQSLNELSERLDRLPEAAWRQDPGRLIRDLEQISDRRDGRDLRTMLVASISREEAILHRQREDADRSLRNVRLLLGGATLSLSLLALGCALYFSRALRRPLDALMAGADALKQGDLSHRIPDRRSDEFGIIARRVNAMAAELQQRRSDEAHARRRLEDLVQERTGELQQALTALQQIDARRRQLFGDISHELRTPTTAIRGEAEITLRGRDKAIDEYKMALRNIADSSRQLGVVIDDLLILARTDVENLALSREPLDAQTVVQAALAEARTLGQERGIRWAVQPSPVPLPMLADARRLRQLLMLVLDNAVRYSRDGQEIAVAARILQDTPEWPQWQFEVRDGGIGIAPDDLPHVFKRNFRGANARSHLPQGTGLGLPLADVLCRAHGGSIAIDSELGRGTTVRINLPLLAAADAPSGPAEA